MYTYHVCLLKIVYKFRLSIIWQYMICWDKYETLLCYPSLDPLANFSGKHLVIVGSISFHTSANYKQTFASAISTGLRF